MMEPFYSCYGCGYVTGESMGQCPRCGRRLRSSKEVRLLGLALLVIGMFLVGMMGTITFNLAPSLSQPGEATTSGSRFTGTAEQALVILGLFGLLIAFGLTSMASGLWQIVTGRRNKWIFIVMLGLFLILALLAWFIRTMLA